MGAKWGAGLAVVLSAMVVASPARAASPGGNPYLTAAQRLYSNLEFDKALEQLERARAYPGSTKDEVVQIEIYTGLVQFNSGNADAARSAFSAALALDPTAQLPEMVSPKIAASWQEIKGQMREVERAQSPPPAPPAPSPSEASPPPTLTPTRTPDAAQVALTTPEPQRSVVSSVGPWAVLGVGVGAAGIGTYFGVATNSDNHTAKTSNIQTAIAAANQSASSDARNADVLFAVAGAAAIGSLAWLIAR